MMMILAGSSADWIRAVDRGRLIHINNMTFELFLSMEQSIRRCVKAGQELGDARSQLKEDENILFYWSILTANQSNDVSTTILEMVVDLWITVRGFSLAGAWMKEYKITQKKTTQKSNALRKQLNLPPSTPPPPPITCTHFLFCLQLQKKVRVHVLNYMASFPFLGYPALISVKCLRFQSLYILIYL